MSNVENKCMIQQVLWLLVVITAWWKVVLLDSLAACLPSTTTRTEASTTPAKHSSLLWMQFKIWQPVSSNESLILPFLLICGLHHRLPLLKFHSQKMKKSANHLKVLHRLWFHVPWQHLLFVSSVDLLLLHHFTLPRLHELATTVCFQELPRNVVSLDHPHFLVLPLLTWLHVFLMAQCRYIHPFRGTMLDWIDLRQQVGHLLPNLPLDLLLPLQLAPLSIPSLSQWLKHHGKHLLPDVDDCAWRLWAFHPFRASLPCNSRHLRCIAVPLPNSPTFCKTVQGVQLGQRGYIETTKLLTAHDACIHRYCGWRNTMPFSLFCLLSCYGSSSFHGENEVHIL